MKTIISRRVPPPPPQKLFRTLNLKEYYDIRNKILIVRGVGGLGDIFMHRMIFEDFKLLMPDAEIHFACPIVYHEAVRDHPFIDHILDSSIVERHKYISSYNTSSACGRYEMQIAPRSDMHRSDIWAAHCGIELTKHDMHFRLTEEEKQWGRDVIEQNRTHPGPVVILAPVSAMETKNLQDHQLDGLVQGLHQRGFCVIGLHKHPVNGLSKINIPTIHNISIRHWMAVIDQSDYMFTVDTAAFHCAGGMGKPLCGVFTFADGIIYGKHFDFVLVQKHRNSDPEWACGPCYNWCSCPKTKTVPKPCLTEITVEMLLDGADKMFEKWPQETLL